MSQPHHFELTPIGRIESPLTNRHGAPRQGREGAPAAWVQVDPAYTDALHLLQVGQDVILITWLHQAHRDVLQVHPRNNPATPLTGVFATRSPDRPNPLGLHRVTIVAIDGTRLQVTPLEAIDGTPVVDIKPVLRHTIDA